MIRKGCLASLSFTGGSMIEITNDEFKLLAAYIKETCGINLKEKKKTLLVGRLSNMLSEMGMSDFMSYYENLKSDTEGILHSQFIDKITTNYTYFMREADHFEYFAKIVLPYLEENVKNRDLRIWCAASSTGEEPYTLTMLMEDYFKKSYLAWDKKLLASDLSLNVLNKAREAIYTREQVDLLPKTWLLNYFDKVSVNEYQIKQSLKKEVIFRRFNLLESCFPFKKKFHVIFCRNVMIYFDNKTKEALINKLYDNLEYGGYLFLGHSESINRDKTRFKYVRPAVYRKIYRG
jgi:chemotaxis protein methyltransferase CheR